MLGIRSFADQFVCPSLTDACNKYLQKHFVEVSKSEEFLSLTVKELGDIISRDELHISSEEQVSLQAIIIKFSLFTKSSLTQELMFVNTKAIQIHGSKLLRCF